MLCTMFNTHAQYAQSRFPMLSLERSSGALLFEPLKPAGRRVQNTDGTGLPSRFFGAELKTWRGEQPLWLTFWIYGAAVSGFLAILYGVAVYAAAPAFQQMLLIVLGAYTVWVLISLWRCTEGAIRLSEMMARFLIVPWATNVTLVLAFMQIGLLSQLSELGKDIAYL
jgi:hypothetical protein